MNEARLSDGQKETKMFQIASELQLVLKNMLIAPAIVAIYEGEEEVEKKAK